jgi:hypothetical protein
VVSVIALLPSSQTVLTDQAIMAADT